MRRCIYSFFLVAILCNTLGLLPVVAQEAKGSVIGTVKDSSGGALKGALVELHPVGQRAVSDEQGQFRFTDVAAGEYTLTVSYVGLSNFTNSVKVIAGQAASADAVLNVAGVTEQVMVTAERVQGEAEAVNVERTADNIVQVLPAEVIRSLPNANMADALGRLPSVTLERDEGEGKYVQVRGTEPRLSNVTMIDGEDVPSPESGVRQIKFDSIPADIVESVEINKTLLPNMDGDGIGGSVNLVTKTATDQPTINLSGMGGYMPILGGRAQVETTGTIGQRFGSQKRFGALIGGSYDWTGTTGALMTSNPHRTSPLFAAATRSQPAVREKALPWAHASASESSPLGRTTTGLLINTLSVRQTVPTSLWTQRSHPIPRYVRDGFEQRFSLSPSGLVSRQCDF